MPILPDSPASPPLDLPRGVRQSTPLPETPVNRGRGFIDDNPSREEVARVRRENEELRAKLAEEHEEHERVRAELSQARRDLTDARARATYAELRLAELLAERDAV